MTIEAEAPRDEVEARHERRPERGETAGEAARRAGARLVGHVEPREPLAEHGDLLRCRSLLRREDVGCVEEARVDVACDVDGYDRCPPSAATAPTPPSVEATPPTATTTRSAPTATAAAISSPTPRLVARSGSFPSAPPASVSPHAWAASMSATPSSSRHEASTGSPSGPVTTVVRFAAAEHVERSLAAVRKR